MGEWTQTIRSSDGPVVITFVALFRTVVSLRIISTDFVFNPSLDSDVIRCAVDANRPQRFLPQPWPTVDTAQPGGLKIGALLKMKSDLSCQYGTGSASSVQILAKINELYPAINPKEQSSGNALFAAVTMLNDAGEVTFEFNYPGSGTFPLESLPDATTSIIDYVTLMVILALTQELEIVRSG